MDNQQSVATMRVFKLNDYEWWVGPDLESCIQAAMKTAGVSREEAADDPCELTDQELDGKRVNVSEYGIDPTYITMRECLQQAIAEGGEFPRYLCGTEW